MIQVETAIPSICKDGTRYNGNIRNEVSSETYTFLYFKNSSKSDPNGIAFFWLSHNKKDISPRPHIY